MDKKIDADLTKEDGSAFADAKDAKQQKDYASALEEAGYNQEVDADLEGIKVRNKHILIKAPPPKKKSSLLLLESTEKEIQSVQDQPGFKDDVIAVAVADDVEQCQQGDQLLLSPHVNELNLDLLSEEGEKVLYWLVHEDYILLTRTQANNND